MAGPFHHDLRRDTAGEGEADEGTAAGVGAYHLILREGFLDTLTGTVADPLDGLVESGKLAEVFQVAVHQLVGQHRKRTSIGEVLILIFIKDGFGETVQVDGKAVVGIHRGHIHRISLDVRPLEVGQIGIAERGESAEAEAVPDLGNLEAIQVQQFLLRQEDDRLLQNLELGPVGFDGQLPAVALPDGPVQEPAQVVELLLDALLLQAVLGAQIHHKFIDACLVEGVEGAAGIVCSQVVGEGGPALEGQVNGITAQIGEKGKDGKEGTGILGDIQSTPVADVKIYSAWSGKELGTTDKDGKFSVTVQSDDTLLFKYKDNDATEVKIEGRRSIAVKLL